MFDIGDEVLCVDDKIKPEALVEISEAFQQWVTEGRKYIVRGFHDNDGIVVGILLEEVHNIPVKMKHLSGRIQEPAFASFRFTKSDTAYNLAAKKKEEEVEEITVKELIEILKN